MRFEVPQFIDIEDKIFGPLTWRQFLYVGGGVGMGVVLFLTANFFIFLLIGLPLAVLAGALAFYPFNNRPFSYLLEAIFNYVSGKKLYLWQNKKPESHIYKSDYKTTIPNPNSQLPNQDGALPQNNFARRLELEVIQKEN